MYQVAVKMMPAPIQVQASVTSPNRIRAKPAVKGRWMNSTGAAPGGPPLRLCQIEAALDPFDVGAGAVEAYRKAGVLLLQDSEPLLHLEHGGLDIRDVGTDRAQMLQNDILSLGHIDIIA